MSDMNQLPATSILSLFETDKKQRESFVADVVGRVDSGNVDPLKVHIHLKCIEEILKSILNTDTYRRAVLDEAAKYPGKTFELYNSEISVRETGVKYDYSKCNDPYLFSKLAEMQALESVIKRRQDFLKTVPAEGMPVMIDDELVTVYPPAKSSTTAATIKLK